MLFNDKVTKTIVLTAALAHFGNDLPANVWVNKVALRDTDDNFYECTPLGSAKRYASEFARIEQNYPNAVDQRTIYERIKDNQFICLQGSPAFGIGNPFQLTSLSNCVVIAPPVDSISGIFDTGKEAALLYARRCGVGIDVSTLRPRGMAVSNAAKSTSGAASFCDFYSSVTRMIATEGRRGALMLTISCKHPDVFEFINMKRDLTKVTGANVSVRLTDDFYAAVEADGDFTLQWPCDVPLSEAKFTKVVRARDLEDAIADAAVTVAEPGALLWDNICSELPAECYDQFKTSSTNPCSEIPLSPYDSCRLISINLVNYVKYPFTPLATFDIEMFIKDVTLGLRLLDDLIDLELEKLQQTFDREDDPSARALWQKMIDSARNGRRTGLGTHGLADCLARMCIKYDSEAALLWCDTLFETFKIAAYTTSVSLAEERGAFPVWDWEKEKDNKFLNRLPVELLEKMKIYGRRNISLLTMAPTGTTSLLSCLNDRTKRYGTSSGIEPVFTNGYVRRVKINDKESEKTPDFIDDLGDAWLEYEVNHPNVDAFKEMNPGSVLPEYFVTAPEIDWRNRVRLQGVIQRHIDHAISSTVNLPKGTSKETVKEIYREAHRSGLKGITVYVDGSRSGVLVSKDEKSNAPTVPPEGRNTPKRPTTLTGVMQHYSDGYAVVVGVLENGSPYEVFYLNASQILVNYSGPVLIDKFKHDDGFTRYTVYTQDETNVAQVKSDDKEPSAASRPTSALLRHGVPVNFIVEQLYKAGRLATDRMARALKEFISEGTKVSSDKTCPECGGDDLRYEQGCVTCHGCGWSKCM